MNNDFFNGPKQDEVMKGIIMKGISNSSEALKTDEQEMFEAIVKAGDVELLSADDIKNTYGDSFWKGEDIANIKKSIDALIKKGEEDYLEEDEFNELEKAMNAVHGLERKAIAVPFRDGHIYKEIFVDPSLKKEETED